MLTLRTALLSACWLSVPRLAHVCLGGVLAFLSLHGRCLPVRKQELLSEGMCDYHSYLLCCQHRLSACSVPGPPLGSGVKIENQSTGEMPSQELQLAPESPGLCWGTQKLGNMEENTSPRLVGSRKEGCLKKALPELTAEEKKLEKENSRQKTQHMFAWRGKNMTSRACTVARPGWVQVWRWEVERDAL